MSAASSAGSIRREDRVARPDGRPLDKVRALQWTLYRCAKQEPERRFHALYGHVHRMDVLWRAWSVVCANRGAPGVDGVSVDAVAAAGVVAAAVDSHRGGPGGDDRRETGPRTGLRDAFHRHELRIPAETVRDR